MQSKVRSATRSNTTSREGPGGSSRRSCALIGVIAAFCPVFSLPAHGQSADSRTVQSFPAEVAIPNTRRIDFTSRVNGHRYSISVALPFEASSGRGYGVLYVLDGFSYFASATEAVRGPEKAPGVLVVGIGYPDDPTYVNNVIARRGPVPALYDGLPSFRFDAYLERLYDLSLPTSEQTLVSFSHDGFPKWPKEHFGGLDDFLKIIETEVKPRVAALAPIDPDNQAIFGHSFGGYAVLHALFNEPNAFRTFIIASPALFWDNKHVLADREKFATAVKEGRASPRVLVTVGSEEKPPAFPPDWAMIENGRALVTWLKSLHGSADYQVEDYAVFAGVSHSFSPWPALARGVSFAFAARQSMRAPVPSQTAALSQQASGSSGRERREAPR
jgi:predicted alpha/beta superfamily hydrolase